VGRAAATSGDRQAGAERLAALIKALMGREPGVYRRSDCRIEFVYHRERLEGFAM
jgi:hypothetical protein